MVMGPGPCWTRPFFKGLDLNFWEPSNSDPGLDPKKIWWVRVRVLRWRPELGPRPGPWTFKFYILNLWFLNSCVLSFIKLQGLDASWFCVYENPNLIFPLNWNKVFFLQFYQISKCRTNYEKPRFDFDDVGLWICSFSLLLNKLDNCSEF